MTSHVRYSSQGMSFRCWGSRKKQWQWHQIVFWRHHLPLSK